MAVLAKREQPFYVIRKKNWAGNSRALHNNTKKARVGLLSRWKDAIKKSKSWVEKMLFDDIWWYKIVVGLVLLTVVLEGSITIEV